MLGTQHSLRCDCMLCKLERETKQRPRTATPATKSTPKVRQTADRAATKTDKKKKK